MKDELLIKFLLKETNAREDSEVTEWLAAGAANQRYFSQMELIWNVSKQLAVTSTVDEDAAWNKFKENAGQLDVQRPRVRMFPGKFLKAAAALLLALGAWSAYILLRPGYTTIESAATVRTEILPDGSEITLNKNASLSYQTRFSGNRRNIKLNKGEVFFKVAPDRKKPFVIASGNTTVTVVGTSFNVKYRNDQTEVIVETGIVKVRNGDNEVLLHAGERALAGKGINLAAQKNPDQLYQFYRSRVFIAHNTPLSRIVEVLNENYDARIRVADPEKAALEITTTLNDENLDHILEILALTLKLTVVKEGDEIILK
ncbi:FecR family protein [Hufsiella ginkgonis]|uniref:DUF4974 domain-containing protein n=1 Tax=Hufsiella ginkgonis TaxID=2695274 RepID=A0A7K1XZ85_9SPHI|nr:FecR domain-containing protein [Hufsiella ginkgonis]MXV16324.1 DUF4974 domain-containing protein [Hufsiella ginkgonis]